METTPSPAAAAAAAPGVASLTASLAVVPSAAVPAIVDCILASSPLSPSALFYSLLNSFPVLADDLRSSSTVSHITALCHLIGNDSAPPDALQLFVSRALVPVLSAIDPDDSELLSQVEDLVCDTVSKTRSWELAGETVVPFCLKSLGLCLGMTQNGESDIYKWSSDASSSGALSLTTACRVLTSLLNLALRGGKDGGSSQSFAASLIWDLSNMLFEFVAHSTENRGHCVSMLLPSLFSSLNALGSVRVLVHGSPHTVSRVYFLKKIWECCLSLFSQGKVDRLDGYSILSLYFSSLYSMQGHNDVSTNVNRAEFDLGEQKEFWEEIRKGLADKDAFVRKQALYVLKSLLSYSFSSSGSTLDQSLYNNSNYTATAKNGQKVSHDMASSVAMTKKEKWADKEAKSLGVGEVYHVDDQGLSSRGRWKVFLLLYEMLEEYGTHLVEAAWSHQVSLLFQSAQSRVYLNPCSCGPFQAQMETSYGIFNWLAVLWERGFFHGNPQVRCLIMQSFLDIDWKKHGNYAVEVPRTFVLGPFILGLNDVVYHKDFGVKGVYTSKTIQGTTIFLREYTRRLSYSERAAFVCTLASIGRQEAFGRAGFMALASCIASVACPSSQQDTCEIQCWPLDKKQENSVQDEVLLCSPADLLDVLSTVIEKSKQHFNSNYRLQVCEQVLKAACSLINVFDVPYNLLLHFLSTVPREFTDINGSLRGMVKHWLSGLSNNSCSVSSADTKEYVLKNLIEFPTSFVKHDQSSDFPFSFDDEDVYAWELLALRWARVFFLVVTEEKQLDPIFMFFQNSIDTFGKQDHTAKCVPLKVLILVLSLLNEFQIGWRKNLYRQAGIHIRKSHVETYVACEMFITRYILILGKLVPFVELVSQIFWSTTVVKSTLLPCSITGKLGGPSQRRLASITTPAVLLAIYSVKAVSRVSSWCSKIKKDDFLDAPFSSLWDFSWKVIQSPTPDSESGAEVRLAAYEALGSVFKAFSSLFKPPAFDFMKSYNKSMFPNEDDIPLLDPLILTFLSNINTLLTSGVLTRSRRAVLMNWKWRCLDSLLSIPYKIEKNGTHLRNVYQLFSDSAIRTTFHDIVESLENAGESSVLPMLRSVRSLLGLLCSGPATTIVSSCTGVDSQMMFKLVRSSWILHLSCNKRRVAPIAALLSAVLHRSVFSDLSMHETTDGHQGPLKWFISELLGEGIKSPRTIRLTALHLTGLWLLYPKTVKYYINELKLLSLYGSVAFDEDFEAELSENHEARLEVSLLAQSPDSELTEMFINTEMYARVSVAVLFHKLAELTDRREGLENGDSLAALQCGKLFLLELLNSAVNDNDLSKELYKKHSAIHRRKVRAWQMICILSRYVEKDIVDEVTSNLHICLSRNNLPAVRQFLEMFAVQVYLRFPTLAEEQLIPMFYDYSLRPQALSSYVFIAANVILHTSELSVQTNHINKLLPPIIPFLTSHHHSLRGFTQLLVHYVLSKLWPSLRPTSSETALEKKCFDDLKSYLAENIDCVRLRASMEGLLDAFDPRTSATPAGIFNASNEVSEFECVPICLMEQVISFLNDVRDDLRSSMAKDASAIKNEFLTVADVCKGMEEAPSANAERISQITTNHSSMDFQKKITFHKTVRQPSITDTDCFSDNAGLSKLLLDMEKEDQLLSPVVQSRIQDMEKIKGSQQQFILVASLLDRIPNLAGLARTCEIFKAAGLAIADASVLQDKQFQLISVTAEKWVPIIEVPVSNMKAFFEKKRREGFSILGLEQTANSVPLDKYSFPSKTVLVMGREKEGIPVDIIHVLDACVEIPQLGIIRSLNVHVSGAIALWEYTRQQRSQRT